jgi:hypothetical protein
MFIPRWGYFHLGKTRRMKHGRSRRSSLDHLTILAFDRFFRSAGVISFSLSLSHSATGRNIDYEVDIMPFLRLKSQRSSHGGWRRFEWLASMSKREFRARRMALVIRLYRARFRDVGRDNVSRWQGGSLTPPRDDLTGAGLTGAL